MIYYLEDDTNIRDLTVYALKQAGLEAAGFAHAGDFFDACRESLPDLVLLDIMLPEVDGLEVLRRLREDPATKFLPVMMLTAKGTEFDKVSGLDAGADDYLAKPFGMMELVSRVNALLRRAAAMCWSAVPSSCACSSTLFPRAASPSSSRSRNSTFCARCFATSGACCRAVSCSRTCGA